MMELKSKHPNYVYKKCLCDTIDFNFFELLII